MREHRGRTTAGRWWAGWLGVWWLVGAVPLAWAAERLALVIGNARYLNERPLVNTLNDARAVADQLRGLGFEVTLHEDLAAIPMRREVNRYLEEVKGREGTVLFYYSGHGMQDRYRASYLIPVDAKVTGQEDIVAYGVGVNDILEKLGERPRDAVSLVILDACRDNPFATQKGGKGLGRVDAGRGTLVLYAAGPGQTADDRPGEPNGLFTQHLLKVLPQPGLDLEDAFDRIAEAVERASNGHQVPYKEGDLRGKYYLGGPPPAEPPATPSDDQTFWQSAERCGTAACFQAYLKKYPQGQFAEMAKARLLPSPPPLRYEPPVGPVTAAERVALVIGNGRYQHASVLPNTGNDARAVAEALQKLGFTLDGGQPYRDLNKAQLEGVLKAFGDRARRAEAVVVYYAGHSVESGGANYLVPVDAALQHEADLALDTVALDTILDQIAGEKEEGWRLVILDACRNNPLAARMARGASGRGVKRGLARVEPAGQTYVAYAAKAGTEALDQDPAGGDHSPFAAVLLDYLSQPLPLERLFGAVREDVRKRTGGRQEPWLYGPFGRDPIYLTPTPPSQPTASASIPSPSRPAVPQKAPPKRSRPQAGPVCDPYSPAYPGNCVIVPVP